MGKKNKYKKDENAGDKQPVQQKNQPQGASQRPGPSGSHVWGQQQSGQGQQQRDPPPQQQQLGHSQPQQQSGHITQQSGPPQQQQGGWRGPQQQSGQGQQQWGAPRQQQQRGHSQPQQQQQSGHISQQSGPPQQQQGAWRGPQQSNQGQQQRDPPPQQQQRGQGRQQGQRQQQQQSVWQGSQQQQRGPPQQQQGGSREPQQSRQGRQQSGPPQQSGRGPQQQSTERSFQQLSISDEQVLPVKQKSCAGLVRGTLGRPGILEVNYVKLNLDGMLKEAYHYDVTIDPDRPKKFLRSAFEQCKREMFGNIEAAFDGNKSCYTVSPLPTPINHKVLVPDSGNRMKEFNVAIKETMDTVVDMDSLRRYHNEKISDKPMRAIQVLDVVLAGNNHERAIRVGRSFFRRPANPFDLEGGYEAWTGLFQAAILGEQPFLNVDIAHKSFPRKSSLLEYLSNQNIRLDQNLDNYAMRDFQRFINGLNIEYEPPPSFGAHPKKYKVLDVGESASRVKFKNDDGQEMTVSEYFRSRGSALKYPNLNCLKVGSTVRSIYLPMEFCSIPEGQVLNRKDGEKQVAKMVRFAATSTNKRKEKIMDMLHYFQHNNCPLLRAFGVQIGSNFIKVPMRLLPAPFMEYLNGQTVTTSRGAWRMDGKMFLNTSKTPNGHKWVILYEQSRNNRGISYHELEAFKKDVLKTSQSLGMNLAADAEIVDYGRNQLQNALDNFSKKNIALVFVVLGNFGTSYAQVKQAAELKVGILTQCIKENTVRRTGRDRTVFSNILLKVNAKLNGTNHKISKDREQDLQRLMDPIKKVMFMGADVTHPSPDQRHIPSVVGVAASHDLFGACYNMQYRLQKSTQEEIDDMEAITTCHLKIFHKYQNCYPDQIIYYRDGVSDGQFPKVRDIELRSIRNACARLKICPKLTCVIVVKRHHTRFFPMTKPRDDRDFNNVEPGTVVDQHVTHPNEVQFFMVSHQSIQGTAKPTRYNVIVDDSNFDINLLQKLTYNLCHLFPRCNRPVSYPAPAYLAHLVAFRGRVYLEGSFKFTNNYKREYESRLIKPEFMVRNPMYFV